jgi:hypothetical protein
MSSLSNEPKTPGEQVVQSYLDSRELSYDYEAQVGNKFPDFTLMHPRHGRVVLDVYEPEMRLPPNTVSSVDAWAVVRKGFQAQSKLDQAKAAVCEHMPFVLVLAETNSDLPMTPEIVTAAMFGNHQVRIAVSVTGDDVPENASLEFGPGGRVQPALNTRFSALAVVRTFNPREVVYERAVRARFDALDRPDLATAYRTAREVTEDLVERKLYDPEAWTTRLDVFHNPYAEYHLSLDVFGGPHDQQWAVREDVPGEWVYGRAASGLRGGELWVNVAP